MQKFKSVVSLAIYIIMLFPVALMAQRNDGAVISGDFADPSIIQVGSKYYAVGTSSEWAPHFPIYQSTDLKNWRHTGYVFNKTPQWTSGSFWAPEYYKIKDTYYIYYTARRKADNMSYIGVATSKYPDKDFTDHGVIIAFGKEAIDAFVFKDHGQLYITFKAYGLDNRPIEILSSKLSADGLKLEGETFSLLKDEPRIGMEGQSILKRNRYYYLFYSAGNCCGAQCGYNVRVARSTKFEGPYEVYEANPILSENYKWKCMGHGTFVKSPNGADLYLHHAYNRESNTLTGRQGLISELKWPANNGWPVFKVQKLIGPPVSDINDSFNSNQIAQYWQWDFRNVTPNIKQQNGALYLSGTAKQSNQVGIVLTTRPVSGNFVMTTTVINHNNALKGLSFYGDANMAAGIGTKNGKVVVWQVKDNKFAVLSEAPVNGSLPVHVQLKLSPDRTCEFLYRTGTTSWKKLKINEVFNASFLTQWDRSPRAGLHFKGNENEHALFADFSIKNID